VLKITARDSERGTRIRLEGRLTAPWVGELERCWRGLATKANVVVDLSQVDYADDAGRYLLAWMHARGVRLEAPSLAMQQITADIEAADASAASSKHSRSRAILPVVILIALFTGAIPVSAQRLRLTLRRAVEMAVSPEGNARIQLAQEAVKQAEARSDQARAALLPDLEGSVGYSNQTRNLAALGIGVESPIPGFQIPTFVGPFNTFDARATVRQSIFDFSSVKRWQSSRKAVDAARAEGGHAEDKVVAQVVRAWLAVLKADADVTSAKANVDLATALLDLIENQKRAGTGTGIEVTRARVQLANEQQRLLLVTNDRRRARLQLLRAIGLRLDTEFEPDGTLAMAVTDPVDEAQARRIAFEKRADYKGQLEREQTARMSASSVSRERLPSVAGFADYGSLGTGITSALPTRMYGLSLRVPIFDGGRKEARRAESASLVRQEQARTRDLRENIELEIRVALDALASATEQVTVASEGLKLAGDELSSARRRYEAGVATSIEITDAQTRLERARDNHVNALFAQNLAQVDLAQAQGTIEDLIR
jgi:outer membrane protein TolC